MKEKESKKQNPQKEKKRSCFGRAGDAFKKAGDPGLEDQEASRIWKRSTYRVIQ